MAILALCSLLVLGAMAGDYWLFDSRPHLALSEFLPPTSLGAHSLALGVTSFDDSTLGRPVTMLSFVVESVLVGDLDARAMRWSNIGLHGINGFLIYLISLRLGRSVARFGERESRQFGLVVATLWVINPMHVSSVLYVIQRMTLMAATFSLTGLLLYLKWLDRSTEGRLGFWHLTLVGLCLVLATLAKENGVVMLFMIALVSALDSQQPLVGRSRRIESSLIIGLLVVLPTLVVGSLVIAPGYYEQWFQGRDFDVWQRLMTQSRILWHYVAWFYLPLPQNLGLYHDDILVSDGLIRPWTTVIALLSWIGVIIAAIRFRVRHPLLVLGAGIYLYTHALESTVIPLEMTFEHRNYLPSFGLSLILGWGLLQLLRRPGSAGLTCVVGILALFLMLQAIRSASWRSEEVLSYSQYRNHPDSNRSLFHYANELLRRGERTQEEEQRKALIVSAYTSYEALANRSDNELVAPVTLLYIDARHFGGNFREKWLQALEHRLEAAKVFSNTDYNALNLLAGCVRSHWCSEYDTEVVRLFELAIGQFPQSASLHRNLAEIQLSRRQLDAALDYANSSLALRPTLQGRWLAASVASSLGRDDIVLEQLKALQKEDKNGRYHSKIVGIFRYGKISD